MKLRKGVPSRCEGEKEEKEIGRRGRREERQRERERHRREIVTKKEGRGGREAGRERERSSLRKRLMKTQKDEEKKAASACIQEWSPHKSQPSGQPNLRLPTSTQYPVLRLLPFVYTLLQSCTWFPVSILALLGMPGRRCRVLGSQTTERYFLTIPGAAEIIQGRDGW